ncbi:hypothetical protein Syun_017088 [Stephania yunnanensis]|uniref:Uncharacterized protein n=1 Tax=Stephania yunnanensis TaxID=152371 RepID=A0AAP0P5I0_9MAGN
MAINRCKRDGETRWILAFAVKVLEEKVALISQVSKLAQWQTSLVRSGPFSGHPTKTYAIGRTRFWNAWKIRVFGGKKLDFVRFSHLSHLALQQGDKQDLEMQVSSNRGMFTSPGQAATVFALWRENLGGADPPLVFTVEDRLAFSAEYGIRDYATPVSEQKSDFKTPLRDSWVESVMPLKSMYETRGSYTVMGGQ